jgi:hypothetical protein
MEGSTGRILTTHAGSSLPRPVDLLEMVASRAAGRPVDTAAYALRLREFESATAIEPHQLSTPRPTNWRTGPSRAGEDRIVISAGIFGSPIGPTRARPCITAT